MRAAVLVLALALGACTAEDPEVTDEPVWRAYVEHTGLPEDQIDWVTPAEVLREAGIICDHLSDRASAAIYSEDTIVLARVLVEALCPTKLELLR